MVLNKSNFTKINYLNLDVEGFELKVLEGFDIDKYQPDVVTIEFLDLSLNKLELKNNSITNVLESDVYKFMINKNYSFVNWIHADLLFVRNDFRD